MMYRYLYTVRHRTDFSGGVDLDCWMEVPPEPNHKAASDALRKLSGIPDPLKNAPKEVSDAVFGMQMRSRFNGDIYDGILLVKAEDNQLDRDIMQNVLDAKQKDGLLGEFLKESKIL